MAAAATPPTCDRVRADLSARLDGEECELRPEVVDAHLDTCDACAAHAGALATLHRRVRLAPAMPVPDLTAGITAAVTLPARSRQRDRQRRWVLALTGVVMALVAVSGLGSSALHAGREVAIFELALGAAVAVAAWRPRHLAAGMLPMTALAGVLMLATAVVDVARGATGAVPEVAHLLPALAAWLLWGLARRPVRGRGDLGADTGAVGAA